MAKLFKLALEEAVVEEPSIVEDVPVEEAVANAEELAKTDSEIQQDIAAVEELVEEKTKLEEQVMTNDELLSNPDAVVTAADVEVSEETRTEVQYSLGYTSNMGKIRLSQESIANDVRSNPRKYLAISNEDIKDTIKKVIEKIKKMINDITNKFIIYVEKSALRSKDYALSIKNTVDKLRDNYELSKRIANGIRRIPKYNDLYKKMIETLKTHSIETRYALINSSVYAPRIYRPSEGRDELKSIYKSLAEYFKSVATHYDNEDAREEVRKISAKNINKANVDPTLFGIETPRSEVNGSNFPCFLIGVTGKKYLDDALNTNSTKFIDIKFKPDFDKLFNSVCEYGLSIRTAAGALDVYFKPYIDLQKEVVKEINAVKVDSNNKEINSKLSLKLDVLTRYACNACVFRMREIIGEIKAFKLIAESIDEIVDFDKEYFKPRQA